jgi:dihydroorotase
MLSIEGNIISTEKQFRGRIEIDQTSGIILKIGEPIGKADILLKDELIFPGFIDLHVHAREDISHTQEYKENFETAGDAAINGGVVFFAEMPNNPIPPIDDITYQEKYELTKKSKVPVILYAGIGQNTKKLSKKVPYKVFMGKSVGDMYFNGEEELEIALKNYEGCFISFHCEDPKTMEENSKNTTHESQRPIEAELRAIDIAINLIEKFHLHGKICHVSTIEGIEKIKQAKKIGIDITVEITPHHLFFDESMFNDEIRKKLQVNPPIRQSRENRLLLIKALKNGDIDYLATDHAPHTIEEKEKGISGMPHLDTYAEFTTWLMVEHNFTPQDISRISIYNPGNFINNFLDEKYGEIKENFVGSLTIIDIKKPKKIIKSFLKTKCNWSPFEGITFPGSSIITIIKGKVYAK